MISICIPTYDRTTLLFESIAHVIDDDRISEVVIVDDCSPIETYNAIIEHYKGNNKVKIYRNENNLDCYRNKREAVSKATNEWVILLDSDNVIDKNYIDSLPLFLDKHVLFQPSFAKPHFDFRAYEGLEIGKENVSEYMCKAGFETMLNAMNYFVNRDEFLRVWDGSVDPVTSDSLFQNYNWLKSGNSIYVVPGMQYFHRVHNGSHYQNNVRRTPQGFHKSIVDKLKGMK